MSVETAVSTAETREEALARMVREHQSSLLRLCYLSLRDTELARDAVQETFLKAYEGLSKFRGESSERTWLTRIALNVCHDVYRANWYRLMDGRALPDIADPLAGPSEDSIELSLAIARLPRKLREVILLYYYEGMSMSEIAEVLHMAKSTVFTRHKHALERLHITIEGGKGHD